MQFTFYTSALYSLKRTGFPDCLIKYSHFIQFFCDNIKIMKKKKLWNYTWWMVDNRTASSSRHGYTLKLTNYSLHIDFIFMTVQGIKFLIKSKQILNNKLGKIILVFNLKVKKSRNAPIGHLYVIWLSFVSFAIIELPFRNNQTNLLIHNKKQLLVYIVWILTLSLNILPSADQCYNIRQSKYCVYTTTLFIHKTLHPNRQTNEKKCSNNVLVVINNMNIKWIFVFLIENRITEEVVSVNKSTRTLLLK